MPKAKRPKKAVKRPARRAPARKKPAARRAKANAPRPRAVKAPRLSPLSGESVDVYVKMLPSPQQVIVNRLRALVASAAPEAMESLKWAQPVFEAEGPFAHIRAASGHVNFGFWRGALLEAPPGLLEGEGDMMRHVKIVTWKDVKEDILRALVRQAVLLNLRLGDPTRR